MKLHLPAPLFRSVLAAMSLVAALTCSLSADAMVQHADVSILTYTDFGQNMGRYATGNTNALLNHIRERDGGVTISYEGGQPDYTMLHGMIDFSGLADGGWAGAIGGNFLATVQHNGVLNPTFTGNTIGASNAIRYSGIEYRYADEFLHTPSNDYKITRLSKILTDVSGSAVYGASDGNFSKITDGSLVGQLIYRAGAGTMYKANHEGGMTKLEGGYITGGIDTIDSVGSFADDGAFSSFTYITWSSEGIGDEEPLPFMGKPGDSGSPMYVWNDAEQRYEYLNAAQSVGGTMTQSRGDCEWTVETMNRYNKTATMGGANGSMVILGAIDTQGETIADATAGVSGTQWSGVLKNGSGHEILRYNGVKTGINTWNDLSSLKDTANWYNYDSGYLNASQDGSGKGLFYADLFHNDNLVLTSAASGKEMYVGLEATVDLGVGYVQFSKEDGVEHANFFVESYMGDASHQLNSAGYIVDAGVEVHLNLTNADASFMREWRKAGEGDLYLQGSGNNEIFLNVGGSGKTFLNQNGGYAAYNVLANNGSTVVISGTGQIARDFTFGYRGGWLDMNGHSMEWNNGNEAAASGFTIHALDEHGIITNSSSQKVTLTWTQGGNQTWLGSFEDTQAGALEFVYHGGADGHLSMHGIHTHLLNNAGSGMTVQSGTVTLVGTTTVHGMGSLTANGTARYTNADDWHYADASMNVTVQQGATFELGSHARLTGKVTVNEGGTYIMREGVKHQMEYIEGGYKLENTDDIRAYFGHKGDVQLNAGSKMEISFNEGADSALVYAGNISGMGSLSVNTGMEGGVLYLEGTSTFSGTKELTQGALLAETNAALGDTATGGKWVIGEKAWLASRGFTEESAADILSHIDGSSTGVLALTSDISTQLDLSGHVGLIIGAAEGATVQYGAEGTQESLAAVNDRWMLGGGGGNLVVNFLLEGEHDLVLGNEYGKGNVHLANTNNTLSGNILFTGGVTLTAADGALGSADINLSYSSRLLGSGASQLNYVDRGGDGVFLVDRLCIAAENIDLSSYPSLYLGSEGDCRYTGAISLAEGQAYRFGGATGTFTVASALESGRDLVIDGQGWSGGRYVLENLASITGAVSVMGYDASRTQGTTGDATLCLTSDNDLAQAASLLVKDGGAVDLAGTSQQLTNAQVLAGGSLLDSSSKRSSVLVLDGETTLEGTHHVAHITKTGNGNLTLGGESTYDRLDVASGSRVTLTSGTGTASGGNLVLAEGVVLDQNGYAANGTISLSKGSRVENFTTVNGTLQVLGDSSLSHTNGTGASTIGKVEVADGTTLSIDAGKENMTISGLAGSGEIGFANTAAHQLGVKILGDNSAFSGHITVHGTITNLYNIGGDNATALTLDRYYSAGTGTLSLDNAVLRLSNANSADTAVQATVDVGDSVGVIAGGQQKAYYFSDLSGSGQLFTNLDWNSSVHFVGDVRSFTGVIDSNKYAEGLNFSGSDLTTFAFGGQGVNYHAVTGDSSPGALRLFGDAGATLKSTSGRKLIAYNVNYSDDVVLNARVEGRANLTHAGAGTLVLSEDNTSSGTLSVTGGGVLQFGNGGDSGSWAGNISGARDVIIKNLSEAGVTLNASSFSGDLSLMVGSKLTLGASGADSLTLSEGRVLTILEADAATAGAQLNAASLVLNGGELSFSASSLLGSDTATLALTQGAVSTGDAFSGTQTISFVDTAALAAGEFLLASGDWSLLSASDFSVSGIESYFETPILRADANGLHLTLNLVDGTMIWDGTAEAHSWSSSAFGSSSTLPAATDTVYFTDSAAMHQVDITENVAVDTLVFNTSQKDYQLSSAHGATLTSAGVEVRGGGSVELGAGVSITGASTVAENSELRVMSFSTLHGAVSGAGTLTVDVGNTVSGWLPGHTSISNLGKLRLLSGRYQAGANALAAATIEVVGGQYYVNGGTHSSNFVLGGNGWAGEANDYASAALRADGGATLSGSVTLSSDAALAVDGTATLSGSLATGDYTLSKTGAGTLTLGSNSLSGNIEVQQGALYLTGQPTSGLNTLTLRRNTTMQLNGAYVKFAANSLVMEDGSRINLRNGNSSGAYFSANIKLTGTATLAGSINGNNTNVQGTIKGDGTLNLARHGGTNMWRISSAISDAEGGSLAVVANSYVQLYGDSSYTGGTTVNGSTLTTGHVNALGGGALTVNAGRVQQHANLLLSTLDGASAAHVSTNAKVLTLGNNTTADDSATFAGTLDGDGTVVKIGEGMQKLTGTVSQSLLSVQAGILALNGTTVSRGIEVLQGGTLALAGDLTLAQTIVSEGSVTLGEGVHFNLTTAFGGYDVSTGTYTIISGGNIDYAGSGITFTVNGISSTDMEPDNYELNAGSNYLSITMRDFMKSVTWNGAGQSDTWSTSGTQENWQQGENSSTFGSLDSVTFGSEGSRGVAVDAAGVRVSTMTVTGSDYAFTGGTIHSVGDVSIAAGASAGVDGALIVDGNLTVAGTAVLGDVTLAGTLTAAGDLTVNGTADFASASITKSLTVGDHGNMSAQLTSSTFSGTVRVGEGATLALAGGSQTFNDEVTLAEGATLSLATTGGRSQFNKALNLTGDATIHYTTGQDLLVSNALQGNGHTITKTGSGLLWLSPSSASGVSFIVEEGKLRVGGAAAKPIPTGIDGITLRAGTELSFTADTSSFATNLTLDGGSSIDLKGTNGADETYTFTGEMNLTGGTVTLKPNATRTLVLDGKVTGSGTLGMDHSGTLTLTLNNAANDFSGGISANRAVTINLGAASAAGTGEIKLTNTSASLNVAGQAGSYGQMQNRITSAGSLAVTSGKVALTAAGSRVKSATVQQGASLKLAGAASLSVADALTVSAKPALARGRAAQVEGVLENVALTASSMTAATAGTLGEVNGAAIAVNASAFSMSELVLNASAVTLYTTARSLQDVVLQGGSTVSGLSEEAPSLVMNEVTLSLPSTVVKTVDGGIYGDAWSGKTVAVYSVDSFSHVSLSGSMLMDVSAMPAPAASSGSAADYIAFDFGEGVTLAEDFVLSANLSADGTPLEGERAGSGYLFAAPGAVPEPTSSALALLGLGVLALRRRRK